LFVRQLISVDISNYLSHNKIHQNLLDLNWVVQGRKIHMLKICYTLSMQMLKQMKSNTWVHKYLTEVLEVSSLEMVLNLWPFAFLLFLLPSLKCRRSWEHSTTTWLQNLFYVYNSSPFFMPSGVVRPSTSITKEFL
jgi:hypothetical protein